MEQIGTSWVVFSQCVNSGLSLITPNRFIDYHQSCNEDLASMMRPFGICEEKGSGFYKVIFIMELFQLPALDVQAQEKHTNVIFYANQNLHRWIRRIGLGLVTNTPV